MSYFLNFKDWLSIARKEYLQDFVKNGGSAVKFVVSEDGFQHEDIVSSLRQVAESEGFFFAAVNAANTKTHMIDKIFHEVAKQVNWDDLAYSFLSRILSNSLKLPDNRSDFTLIKIANLNALSERAMRSIIDNKLEELVYKDYSMTQEFRIAMLRLCEYQLVPEEIHTDTYNCIKEWLQGELHLLSHLKKSALIFQKIGRHNARQMLFSLSHWLKIAGKSGMALSLDISRYTEEQRPKEPDGSLYYNVPAVIDGYEALRQLIDGTDELESGFIVVLARPYFLNSEARRGLYIYDALKFRIWDEVHDKVRINPLSALIRVSSANQMYIPGTQ